MHPRLTVNARSSGTPAVIAKGGDETGITGSSNCNRSADVLVGDILVESSTGREFSAVQIYKQPGSLQALVAKIFPQIPDEFESGVMEKF